MPKTAAVPLALIRQQLLAALGRLDESKQCLPNATELAEQIGQKHDISRVRDALRDLAHRGLVEKAGIAMNNARTWRLTASGRSNGEKYSAYG